MLQKALHLTTKDTVNLLCADGISSPNDTICIMANGKAGNYKISNDDTEFAKFTAALRKVLVEICKRIVEDCDAQQKTLLCKVTGAKSQPAAHAIARNVVSSQRIRQAISQGRLEVENIAYAISEGDPNARFDGLQIALCGDGEECVLFEENEVLPILEENLFRLARAAEITVQISMKDGNYTAMAFGCLQTKDFA